MASLGSQLLTTLHQRAAYCSTVVKLKQFSRGLREIDIMEDQGSHGDRNAGFGSTDGQWHHIAVTWESSTGIATLYLDGRKVRSP
jgi:hypothetical protein